MNNVTVLIVIVSETNPVGQVTSDNVTDPLAVPGSFRAWAALSLGSLGAQHVHGRSHIVLVNCQLVPWGLFSLTITLHTVTFASDCQLEACLVRH